MLPPLFFVIVEGFALALRCLGKLTRGLTLFGHSCSLLGGGEVLEQIKHPQPRCSVEPEALAALKEIPHAAHSSVLNASELCGEVCLGVASRPVGQFAIPSIEFDQLVLTCEDHQAIFVRLMHAIGQKLVCGGRLGTEGQQSNARLHTRNW